MGHGIQVLRKELFLELKIVGAKNLHFFAIGAMHFHLIYSHCGFVWKSIGSQKNEMTEDINFSNFFVRLTFLDF